MKKILLFGILIAIIIIGGVLLYQPSLKENGDASQDSDEGFDQTPQPDIETSNIQYYANTIGYFATPAKEGAYPGVVMIHEWWGLNENIKEMARELAREGYLVLAVDLFNGEVAKNPEQARKLISLLDQEEAIRNLRAAAAFVRNQGAQRVASLGWCFGGGQSLQLALSGEELDATVIYYGNLVTEPSELSPITWPVLGIFGDQDQSISVDTINTFDVSLDEAGIENEIYIYPGVGHAFANPSGDNHAPEETADAWQKTLTFLRTHLATPR